MKLLWGAFSVSENSGRAGEAVRGGRARAAPDLRRAPYPAVPPAVSISLRWTTIFASLVT